METSHDSSNVNPLALLFLVAMSFLMLRGQRQAAAKSLLAIAAFLPLGQQIVLFGFHFHFFRILIAVGFARLLLRGEMRGAELNGLDKLVVWWALAGFACGLLRKPEAWAGGDSLGALYNDLGAYFLFRFLIRDPEEVIDHLRFMAFAAVIIAVAMAYEVIIHKNLFYVFGGVPEFVDARDGRFRCQGPFRHPILAGTFAATLFPLMVGLWLQGGRKRWLALAGIAGSAFSTVAAASSGALLTCIAAIFGFALWPMRHRMHLFRRGIIVLVLSLILVMKAPVWYLIAKLSDPLGGTGWHRSYLIDQAVGHFDEWWMIGSSYTAHWAPSGQVLAADPNNMDITNHYVAQGLQGGVLKLGLFIAVIIGCFRTIGSWVRVGEDSSLDPKLAWALGVGLACHCTAFISISYFDQIEVFWLWLWAVVAMLSERMPQPVENIPEADAPAGRTFEGNNVSVPAE